MKETYPGCAVFANAANSPSPANRGFNENRHGEYVIEGLYRISPRKLLQVRMTYAGFPSFCGGSYGFHPLSIVIKSPRGTSWDTGPIWYGRRVDAARCEDVEGLLDLSDGSWCDLGARNAERLWEEYGYRILANGMYSTMVAAGKRGIVLTGPTSFPVADFCTQAASMTQMRHFRYAFGDSMVKWDHGPVTWPRAAPVTAVEPRLQGSDKDMEWRNYNSQNMVRYWPIVLTCPLLGGSEFDTGSRRRTTAYDMATGIWRKMSEEEQWAWRGSFDAYYRAEGQYLSPHGEVRVDAVREDEIVYGNNIYKYIQRGD